MNRLYRDYPSIKNYYSPAIQTIKAQYTVLCSKVPRLRGKISYALDQYNFSCLPKLMHEMGYQTFFYKSYKDMNFDNTQKFAEKVGFDFIETANLKKIDPLKLNKVVWGWGVQDDISYQLFLERSLELKEKNKKPIFSVMTTVSHHFGFNIPKRLNKLYESPSNKKEKFENSLHLSDEYLKGLLDFIEEKSLKITLLLSLPLIIVFQMENTVTFQMNWVHLRKTLKLLL